MLERCLVCISSRFSVDGLFLIVERVQVRASANGGIALDYLSTSPNHQRQGIGAALLRSGLDLADKLRLKTYVTASPIGLKLYLDHGFEVVKKLEVDYSMYVEGAEKAVDWYMIRLPKNGPV
jgi:ribosomal protein S18 acetylase RimI-like enzyme